MRKKRLKIVRRPNCHGWYIRPTENGKSRWVFLSNQKLEAEKLALDYQRQRMLKKVEGFNPQADIDLSIERYLKEKFATSLTTKKSRQRYEMVIRRFGGFLKKHPVAHVSEITRQIVADYLNERNESVADKTWNLERGVLTNFFRFCMDNEWIIKNPVAKIPVKKIPDPNIEHLNEEEAEKLLKYIKEHSGKMSYYEIIATLLYTGMRVNEATHLTKQDILLDKGLMVIQEKIVRGEKWTPKTKERRFVPIPDAIRDIIDKQMRMKSDLIFPNTKDNIIGDRHILEKLKKYCVKAGVKPVHTHSLRHTFTSVSSEKGIPEPYIQAVLGHKTAGMTRRYRHLRPEFLGEQFKNFSYRQDNKSVL